MKLFTIITVLIGSTLSFSSFGLSGNWVCLFMQANFQGGHYCFAPGQRPPDLDDFPLSDGTYAQGTYGSIEVFGSAAATIYDSSNYQSQAQPMYITQSIPDLSTAWTTTIYSIDVETPQ